MKQKLLEAYVTEIVKEEVLLYEGVFSNIKKGLKYAGKLAWLQATKGPGAVSDELINKLDDFVKKVKTNDKIASMFSDVISDLEEQLETVKVTKQRYRDERGRFASSRK